MRESEEQLAEANIKKAEVEALVADLNEKLDVLESEFKAAMDEKQAAEDQAARCANRLDLATSLINALGSNQELW